VQGDEQRVRIVPVNVLGSVTVVTVRVDDGHPVDAVGFAQVLDHDGFDIHVAESPRAVHDPHGMVTGRTDQGEPPLDVLFHHLDADGLGPAGADQV